ncbi:MAG: PHP domain-containing protein [Candidatus Gastranaerophilales bacterium]|nr:PHP domain-containing protein [Candidatus Gastranaerophilales bacterium]
MNENLLNIKDEDFMNTVDLHFHTTHSDGKNTPDEMLNAYKGKGFKKLSITDHNRMSAYKDLNVPEGIELIKGIEFDCWDGYVFMHILGYNIDTENEKLKKLCAKNKLAATNDIIRFINHRSAKKVIKAIKEAGGTAILAHPACCWSLNIKKTIQKLISYGLDGIETNYYYRRHRAYTKFYSAEEIKKIGDELGILQTGGSDSHSVEAIIKKN